MNAEERVQTAIAADAEELIALASDLIRFDTTTRGADGEPAREEDDLQRFLAKRLKAAGAEIELWEPERGSLDSAGRQVPLGLSFAGRPQLVARFEGTGNGRSLLFNGHIDAVSAEPRERWTGAPHKPVVRDDRLYGRGACDMKGGVAAMVFAATVLARQDIKLGGDLVVNTVTDEEWNGAGALASAMAGVEADAGLVPEPSGFEAWGACRGILGPTITVVGRPGHAETPQPSWRDGGAVNAIEKALLVVEALRALRERWRTDENHTHRFLEPGDLVPTMIKGGEWWVSYPASCELAIDVTYLPSQADAAGGWGTEVEREIEDWVTSLTRKDSWLAENPPQFNWGTDLPPAEVPSDHPIVECVLRAGETVGRVGRVSALHSWHDAATFTRFGTPTISYGPSSIGPRGESLPHALDENVRVGDLIACAQAFALAAMRFTAA